MMLTEAGSTSGEDAPVFWMDKKKLQDEIVPAVEQLPDDVIVSPDTRRPQRLPPGQSRTRKWPVLDAGGPPQIDLERWTFRVSGLVANPISWSWKEFQQLPRVKVFSDFHCVTRWSRLGNLWEGVSTIELIRLAGGALPEARFVLVSGYDGGWTTNLSLSDFLAEDSLVALLHDGEPLATEHGGPARLLVPRLYAWKSAKWVAGIELLERDRAGFWEKNGYHMHGDPWTEERHSW
jgi:DMSO/TMAO reductase YedYZ molybdopterin-dependent catalytic subunit